VTSLVCEYCTDKSEESDPDTGTGDSLSETPDSVGQMSPSTDHDSKRCWATSIMSRISGVHPLNRSSSRGVAMATSDDRVGLPVPTYGVNDVDDNELFQVKKKTDQFDWSHSN